MTFSLELDSVVKRYRTMERNAVDQVSFAVAAGESFGLLGPNGAGKTTTVKMVCGASAPTSGTVRVWGLDPLKDQSVKRRVGVVHQGAAFEMMLTVADNLKIAAALKQVDRATARRRATSLLEEFGIAAASKQPVFTLSGGQQKRLAVVRALLEEPDLLILDEPSAGLDIEGRRRVWGLVHDVRKRGTTIIWTSHDMDEIERNCDRIAVLYQGRLATMATPEELVARTGATVAVVELGAVEDVTSFGELAARLGFSAHRVGGHYEIVGEDIRDRLPVLMSAAQDDGIAVDGVRFRPPRLEDAFAELIRQEAQ